MTKQKTLFITILTFTMLIPFFFSCPEKATYIRIIDITPNSNLTEVDTTFDITVEYKATYLGNDNDGYSISLQSNNDTTSDFGDIQNSDKLVTLYSIQKTESMGEAQLIYKLKPVNWANDDFEIQVSLETNFDLGNLVVATDKRILTF